MVRVPLGTEVRMLLEGGTEKVADLVESGQRLAVAQGGKGGWGNARFATAVHQAPRIAQRGQPGEARRLVLDLKLLADVGIVGLPNAGKSTLLRALSAARPKVADYPFTTLEAVLGVVEHANETFVMGDIPGLIEGAHAGAGLGLDFLRHIERTKVILHLLDGSRADPAGDLETVREELRKYGGGLVERAAIVAVNKVDLREVWARRGALTRAFTKKRIEPVFISAATGEGVDILVEELVRALEKVHLAPPAGRQLGEVQARRPARAVTIRRADGAFAVEGERVVAFAEMMPLEEEEGREELWRRLGRWGVVAALRRAGAKPGDRVRLGRVELEWQG